MVAAAGRPVTVVRADPERGQGTAKVKGELEDLALKALHPDVYDDLIRDNFGPIVVPKGQRAGVQFTFFWTEAGTWEGRDFQVRVEEGSR